MRGENAAVSSYETVLICSPLWKSETLPCIAQSARFRAAASRSSCMSLSQRESLEQQHVPMVTLQSTVRKMSVHGATKST
jgi:hypothetical protein